MLHLIAWQLIKTNYKYIINVHQNVLLFPYKKKKNINNLYKKFIEKNNIKICTFKSKITVVTHSIIIMIKYKSIEIIIIYI